ncbi:MAG: 3-keto-5-aminohexanoate cleavage protein [Hyphomicrobiales bacterium]|nr:3-keto-5-aminohexanoate cleavage protein [Hyphomicrobiales bacterium]
MANPGAGAAPAPAPWTPFVVSVAPNGAKRGKADHPALPVTADEVAEAAARCHAAGAALLHLHVRDRDGGHLLDADAYRAATAAVRARVGDGLIVQVTTEAVGIYTPDQQMAVVRDLRPEAATVAIRELVPDAAAEAAAGDFFAWMHRQRVMAQYILYSADDLAWFRDLRRRGVVPGARVSVLFVLGRYTRGQVSTPADLVPFLADPGDGSETWSMCAFGPREGACALAAAALGGHARVGFENNMALNDGTPAPDNAALVAQAAAGAAALGRPLADAAAARDLWAAA